MQVLIDGIGFVHARTRDRHLPRCAGRDLDLAAAGFEHLSVFEVVLGIAQFDVE
ncbi:hypothetical protein [Thiohalobacter thiocyanaticus]|uniref:hypothetical protein n=1 Tax=Thiohalobacter thiocyanaticus TaxID=585455 RepID=UPI001319E423|nr:hypothetical protein [Thiohalobacter thiocyanaticus]